MLPPYSALQCHLECSPGYVSSISPVVTCVDGKYEPQEPSAFKCQPAVGLLVSTTGEMEIFSNNKKCSQKLATFPKFSLRDHSTDVVNDKLIIEGYSALEARRLQFSMEGVRGGVLAISYKRKTSLGSPDIHKNYVFGEDT